ncbi:MAG: acyl-CoA thioesterase [Dethiobacter sp.]|nr:acyl-CoA thioesterase [Dethiobacter sp.]
MDKNNYNPVPLYISQHKVRFFDTDLSAAVFFANHIAWFDSIAIMDYLESLEIDWKELIKNHIDCAVASVSFEYKTPIRLDDLIDITVDSVKLGNKSITLEGSLYKHKTGELVAVGKMVYVFINTKTRKPVEAPDIVRKKLS